jgi:hypothetical protein
VSIKKEPRVFLSGERRTPAYERAVGALKDLLQQEGLDDVERVFAEVASPAIEATVSRGYARSGRGRHVCVHHLAGARCQEGRGRYGRCETAYLPALDHLSGWKQGGRLTRIVSQPYGLRYVDVKETVKFCERWGLEADISAWHSWHFPGDTLSVMYRRKEAAAKNTATQINGARLHTEEAA